MFFRVSSSAAAHPPSSRVEAHTHRPLPAAELNFPSPPRVFHFRRWQDPSTGRVRITYGPGDAHTVPASPELDVWAFGARTQQHCSRTLRRG